MSLRNDLPIQRADAAATRQLLLLFHGVGSSAEDLRPLGEALAAQRPQVAPPQVALHLLHGDQDRVMPPALADDAVRRWRALGGNASLDTFTGLGHGIDARVVRRVAEHLAATP